MEKIIISLVSVLLWTASCTPVVKEYKDLKSRTYRKYYASGLSPEYRGDSLRNIRFPVGGMGSGYVLLGGRGQFLAAEDSQGEIPRLSKSAFAIRFHEGSEFNSVREVEFSPEVRIAEGRIPEDMAGHRGRSDRPMSHSSTARAHWRPSRMAQTTRD